MESAQSSNTALVSIIMLTYNHQKFVAQAIESIVNQQTDFSFQLIIGDDCSSDKTRSICQSYKNKYPDKIQLLFHQKNLGPQPNFFVCYEQARKSEYIAFCEGDDYWIDEHKLQKQVSFMSQNHEYVICFSNARIEFFEGNDEPYELNSGLKKDTFELKDLIDKQEVWFMATASLLYRTSAIGTLPEWLKKSKSGDIPLAILAARNGKIKFLPEVMVVYRKHSGGISLTDHKNDEVFLKNRIFMYNMLNRETERKFNYLLRYNIGGYYFMLLNSKQYIHNYFKKLPILFTYLKLTFPKVPYLKELIRDHIIPPPIINLFRFIKTKAGLMPVQEEI